ncbi:MAG: serine hydrolase [Sulfuricaulis sp.]|uniref:serine hydrolase n=1 Tax=Sulfuricaulis sp. TaxID=2003553 RepID=UPI003C32B4C4
MKPSRILVALATVAGIAATALHVTSNANVTPPPPAAVDEPASYIKAEDIIQYGQPNRLSLQSNVAIVMDDREGVMLYGRNVDRPRPIASLTKLMTALVIIESGLSLEEQIKITREDRDRLRGTRSRLGFNAVFTRYDLLRAALGASDNRAAAALARTYTGGQEAMVQAMNAKAQALGMTQTRYADASGLNSGNVSTARDLTLLVAETRKHALLHTLTTTASFRITDQTSGRELAYHNTNRLLRKDSWDIALSKTGYTAAAGNCLLMQTTIANRPLTIVLLDSWGKYSRYGDANRIHQWLQKAERRVPHIVTARAAPG